MAGLTAKGGFFKSHPGAKDILLTVAFSLSWAVFSFIVGNLQNQVNTLDVKVYELRANSVTNEQLAKMEDRIQRQIDYRFDMVQSQILRLSDGFQKLNDSSQRIEEYLKHKK